MEGIFRKQKYNTLYYVAGLLVSVFDALLFIYVLCVEDISSLDDAILRGFFICFFTLLASFFGMGLFVHKKAYIKVNNGKISAFCHFGLWLNCDIQDVDSVSYGNFSLSIYLKNGKRYNLINLDNVEQVGTYIRRRLSPKAKTIWNKEELLEEVPLLRKKRLHECIISMSCFVLIIPAIFLIASLTGWKDLTDFVAGDWVILGSGAGVSVALVIIGCVYLRKCLWSVEQLYNKGQVLYQMILQTAPLQPGNAIKLFLSNGLDAPDRGMCASYRLTVYGFPNSTSVYFITEHVNQKNQIEHIHTSSVYPDISALSEFLADMSEIPLP